MMEVQKYLQNEGFSALTDEFGIKCKHYPEDDIWLLDYDQINSPKSHPIVIECRSLIVNGNGDVISRSFDRFFNCGEVPEYYQDFEFNSAVIFEKADGSLIKVYHNPATDKWEISTRGMAKAEGEHIMGGTFREKVLDAFGFSGEAEFQEFARDNMAKYATYIFEYCSPENRIVTQYAEAHMVLLGIRLKTGEYGSVQSMKEFVYFMDTAFSYHVRMPKTYSANSVEDLLEAAKELPNLEEGYVVWDTRTNKRMKIKSPTYVIAHKMRGENGLTPKNVLSLTLEGEVDEYLSYFPLDKPHFDAAAAQLADLEQQMTELWEKVKHIEVQKDFALQVKDFHAYGVLFEARKQNVNPIKAFHGMLLNKKLKLLGV